MKKNHLNKIIKKSNSNSGFTFIEVLVAATIIGILTTIGVVSYQQATKKGRDGKRKSDLAQIQSALEIYRSDNNLYPLTGEFPTFGSTWTNTSGNIYMQKVPQDPKSPTYTYNYNSADGNTYNLCAYLESKSTSDSGCGAVLSCGDQNCNYGVTNP